MTTITITLQTLNDGETYAGLILKQDGTISHHLILLPGDNYETTWEEQAEWAKSIGGDLPNCQEHSMLFANCKQHFKETLYWSGEQHATKSCWAWAQDFYGGITDDYPKSLDLRARAVRRVFI